MALKVRPIELRDANDFIEKHHRHHKKVIGHRFSLSAWEGNTLVGVIICGRPVARNTDQLNVLEVTRLCTDGTKNACSFLYAAAARIAGIMGYKRIQTFILDSEPATTLKAAGWTLDGKSAGGTWSGTPSRGARQHAHPTDPKQRWVRKFDGQ